jgi:hypothetical protein
VYSLCPSEHPLHFVRGLDRCYCLRTWQAQKSLIAAIENSKADYIVPADDRAIWQLHGLVVSHPQYRELVERSLGDANNFAAVRSRTSLLSVAESLHIQTPLTVPLRNDDEAESYSRSWKFPAVVKLDGTNGGRGVAVVLNSRELLEAYRRFRRKTPFVAKFKRRLVDDDVLAFFQPSTLLSQGISLQSFVAGTPANAMYSCFRGKLLATLQVRTICAQHATGAALIVERINDPRIEEAGRRLVQELSLSGFIGLDFVLENVSGIPYLLEMNPRATQLGHLPLETIGAEGSLAEALWLAWTGKTPLQTGHVPGSSKPAERIAFYPQALALGPNSSLLISAWLDRPEEEPELVRELSRMSWPERRLIYRLFHRFYSVSPDESVVFRDSDSKAEFS